MKFFNTIATSVLLSIPVYAYPGMKGLGAELNKRIAQQAGSADGDAPAELIGDLKNGATSSVGQSIANILVGDESAQSSTASYFPPILGTQVGA
jgi:hypothetical protein